MLGVQAVEGEAQLPDLALSWGALGDPVAPEARVAQGVFGCQGV